MDRLNCFMCDESILHGLDGLSAHFINYHGLTLNRGLGNRGFICGQNGCRRNFTHFYSLRKHIRNIHNVEKQDDQECEQYQFIDTANFDYFNDNNQDGFHNQPVCKKENEVNEDEVCDEVRFDLKTFITRIIGKLQSNGSMTDSIMSSILDEFEQFSFYLRDFLKDRVYKGLKDQELLDDSNITEVMELFEFENPFPGIRTDEQIDDLLTNSETCTNVPKMIMESFEYVPVKNTIPDIIIADDGPSPHASEKLVHPEQNLDILLTNNSITDTTAVSISSLFSLHGSVTSTLLNHPQGEVVVLAAKNSFAEENRRTMVRILVSELIKVYNNCYPPENAKIALAKAIVEEFPLLKDAKTKKGYEHYYNEETKRGYIEYRLWTVRTSLSPSMKKYKKSRKENVNKKSNMNSSLSNLLSREELSSKVALKKFKNSSDSNSLCVTGTSDEQIDALLTNSETCTNVPKIIMDAFQYVSVKNAIPEIVMAEGPSPYASEKLVHPEQNLEILSTSNRSPDTTAVSISNLFSLHGNVTSTLLNHPQGEVVVWAAKNSFSEENRRTMVRILVSELIKVYDNCYPPENAKIALAKAIVEEFPLLKDVKAKKGYEHYYNEETRRGFIEYRLWTVRTSLSPSMKKYKKPRKENVNKKRKVDSPLSNLLSKEDLDIKVAWMKSNHPSDSTKSDIEKYLKETRSNRRRWILDSSPTISEIFEEYPRLLDFNGDMINEEFEGLFENKGENFLSKFSSYYCPRILKYANINRHDIYKRFNYITNENLRALITLATLLPTNNATFSKTSNSKGRSKKKQIKRPRLEDATEPPAEQSENHSSFFIKFVSEGTNLTYNEQQTQSMSGSNALPYILCVTRQNNKSTYFVQGDGWFLKPHNNDPVNAFDLLFKTYFILNVCYPVGLQNFFNFMENFIYDLGTGTRGVTTSLHINLCNLNLDDTSGDAEPSTSK